MVNKKGFVWLLFIVSGCNGIDWPNRMGAGMSSPRYQAIRSDAEVITTVMARAATIERFIQAVIAAAGNVGDIKEFTRCIGKVADALSAALVSIPAAKVRLAPALDPAVSVRLSVNRARVIARLVCNLTVDRKAIACLLLAAITANRNFFAQGYAILPLINAISALIDACGCVTAQGHAILALINAVELLASAAESRAIDGAFAVDAMRTADKLAAVAIYVARGTYKLNQHFLKCFFGNSDLKFDKNARIAQFAQSMQEAEGIENEKCVICFEYGNVNQRVYPLPDCPRQLHYFHIACIKEYIKKTSLNDLTCPVCRDIIAL